MDANIKAARDALEAENIVFIDELAELVTERGERVWEDGTAEVLRTHCYPRFETRASFAYGAINTLLYRLRRGVELDECGARSLESALARCVAHQNGVMDPCNGCVSRATGLSTLLRDSKSDWISRPERFCEATGCKAR